MARSDRERWEAKKESGETDLSYAEWLAEEHAYYADQLYDEMRDRQAERADK